MGEKKRSPQRKRCCPHDLPLVVWWDIFILLPAKSLVFSRAVCKEWHSVIDDPLFARSHFDKHHHQITSSKVNNNNNILLRISSTSPPFAPFYSVDLDALIPSSKALQTIPATPARLPLPNHQFFPLATCHGLFFDEEKLEIWNPLFLGDRFKLPLEGGDGFTLPDLRKDSVVIGLGYDRATNDYKAVVIDRLGSFQGPPYPTYVYSLRLDSWRRIEDYTYGDEEEEGDWGPGLFVGGALHWISSSSEIENRIIFALDLETEEYRKLQLPPFRESQSHRFGQGVWREREIDVLDGCLVVTDFCTDYFDDYYLHFDAWVLEEEGSWTKLFSLGDNYDCRQILHLIRPVAYMKNKRYIFSQYFDSLFLVDAERGELKKVSIRGLTYEFFSAQLFQETLIRPKHICGSGGVVDGHGRKKMSSSNKRKTRMMDKCNTVLCFSLSDYSSTSDTTHTSDLDE